MKKTALALIAASLLSGCIDSKDDCDNGVVPISLTSKIVVSERSSLQDVQIVAGQEVSFFVTRTGDHADVYYENVLLEADGDGNFTYDFVGGGIMYYPTEPVNVDFFAMHPYNEAAGLGSTIFFAVKEDQTIAKNYYDSDLLFAQVVDIEKTRQAVPMVFNHKLTKLTFEIKQGEGIDLSGLSNMGVMNIQIDVDMDVSNGLIIQGSGLETEVQVYGVRGSGGAPEVKGMAAIIAPHLFHGNGARELFKIEINGAKYYYRPTMDVYFESGKVYSYILTISNTGIVVTSSINDWFPGGDIEEEIT